MAARRQRPTASGRGAAAVGLVAHGVVVLGLARHARLVGGGGHVAVGGAAPARVERAVERARPRARRRRRRAAGPSAAAAPSAGALDRDAARARRARSSREALRRRRVVRRGAARRDGHVAVARRGRTAAGRAASRGCPRCAAHQTTAWCCARGSARRRPAAGPRRAARRRAACLWRLVVAARPARRRSCAAGVGVVVDDRVGLARRCSRLPQVRHVDDRELEPLAAVDGQHLHGLGVGLQPAAALLVARVAVGLGDPPAQPDGQRGRAELLGRAPPRAAAGRRGAGRSAAARRRRRRACAPAAARQRDTSPPARRCPASRSTRAQSCRRPWTSSHAVLGGAGHALGAPADERRQRGRARARGRGRALQRLQQPQPLARRLGGEHAARAVDHRGHAGRLQRVADPRGVAVGGARARRCRRGANAPRTSSVLARCRAATSCGHVARRAESLRMRAGARRDLDARVGRGARAAKRSGAPRQLAPARRSVAAAHAPVDDPLVPELRAAEQRVVGVDQRLVAAPVDVERGLRAGGRRPRRGRRRRRRRGRRRWPVSGRRSAPASRRSAPNAVLQDVPLDRVGVLELVDQHDAVAAAQAAPPRPGSRERVGAAASAGRRRS